MTFRTTLIAAFLAATAAVALHLFALAEVTHAGVLRYRAEDRTLLVDGFTGEVNNYTVTTNVSENAGGQWAAEGQYVNVFALGEKFLLHNSAKPMCWFSTSGTGDAITGIRCFRGFVDRVRVYGADRGDELACLTGSLPCRIEGGAGADRLRHGTADDVLVGGTGDDVIEPDDTNARGGGGDDLMDGGPGVDTLTGGIGRDDLLGDDGADTMKGGPGNDLLEPGLGDDVVDGEDGTDTLSYADRYVGIGARLSNGPAGSGGNGATGEDDRARSVENLRGGRGDDELRGSPLANKIDGGQGGDDTITGGPGADLIIGRSGADTIAGGTGADRLLAGQGADAVVSADEAIDARVDCGSGTDELVRDVLDPQTSCEQVTVKLGDVRP